jgi:hypothetical protein
VLFEEDPISGICIRRGKDPSLQRLKERVLALEGEARSGYAGNDIGVAVGHMPIVRLAESRLLATPLVAPSYPSIVDVLKPGCWQLRLTTGRVRVGVVVHAVRG